MRHAKVLLGLAGSVAVLAASPAFAHAHLVKSDPAPRASVASPGKLSLTFSEKLVPAFSKLVLTMPMGKQSMTVPLKTAVGADGRTLIGTPQGTLAAGGYTIKWTAATTDGHKTAGSVPFQVR